MRKPAIRQQLQRPPVPQLPPLCDGSAPSGGTRAMPAAPGRGQPAGSGTPRSYPHPRRTTRCRLSTRTGRAHRPTGPGGRRPGGWLPADDRAPILYVPRSGLLTTGAPTGPGTRAPSTHTRDGFGLPPPDTKTVVPVRRKPPVTSAGGPASATSRGLARRPIGTPVSASSARSARLGEARSVSTRPDATAFTRMSSCVQSDGLLCAARRTRRQSTRFGRMPARMPHFERAPGSGPCPATGRLPSWCGRIARAAAVRGGSPFSV